VNDLNEDDRALLDLVRGGDEPTSADRHRVRAALAAQLGLGAGLVSGSAGASGGALASPWLVGWAAKILVTAVVVGELTGASAVAYRSMRPAALAARTVGVRSPREAPPSPMPEAMTAAPASVAATPPAAFAPAIDRDAPAPAPPRRVPGANPPLANAKPPALAIAEDPPSAGPPGASPAEMSLTPSEPPSPPPAALPMPPPLSPTTLEIETPLVGGAVAALHGGDAARALALLDEHARRFPTGALAQERMVERIAALCALRRQGEARSAAAAFLSSHGGSPLAERVRASCGGRDAIP
jgi:hypothetical protein